MCYSATTIARYFVENSNVGKTPMQINKMTYIAHGWSLAISNEELIIEDIEAWKYGPVVPILYYEFKKFGNSFIPRKPIEEFKSLKDNDIKLLNKIIDVYGKFDGLQLSSLTHQKGTPWYQVWRSNGRNVVIPNCIIREYYITKAKQQIHRSFSNKS